MVCLVSAAWGGTFGKVVPIGGHASDIALDERRGVVYLANFTANRIEVISISDYSRKTPIRVPRQPGSIALSPDARYMVVTHFGKWDATFTIKPSVTILDLDTNQSRNIDLGDNPLTVAFGGGSRALLVTEGTVAAAGRFLLLDPASGSLEVLAPALVGADQLPVPFATFPPEIIKASGGVSGDNRWIIGMASAQQAEQALTVQYRYNVQTRQLSVIFITSAPPLGPRVVSVNQDASMSLLGWALFSQEFILMAQFPYPRGEFQVGSHAFDWSRNLIYGQIPEAVETEAPPDGNDGETPPEEPVEQPLGPAVLQIFDSDNLTVRERISLPENLAGKSILSRDMQYMYSVSDSGLMVLPVGLINQSPRVTALQEDVLFRAGFCDNRLMTQEIDIVDPGGGATDFTLSTDTPGVTISPASGTTPARVKVTVDPIVFQNNKGTVVASLNLQSNLAVNIPMPVRVLINTREPEQRGTIVNVPGKIVDLLADPVRNRFYVIRQDKNQVLVFDGAGYNLIATLRTGNTPVSMAMTRDNRFLIVGNDNSQIANVYDLDLLQPSNFIVFPFGHYPRVIAASSKAILATTRGVGESAGCPPGPGVNTIDQIHFDNRTATTLPSLGIYCNSIDVGTVLTATPSGSLILGASPDGTVMLYEADGDTFVASRQDFTDLGGALGTLTDEIFAVDNNVLNWSLVPVLALDTSTGASSGVGFADGLGLRTTATSPFAPGTIQRFDILKGTSIRPTRMVEAPLVSAAIETLPIGQIGQTILPFLRTLAPLPNRSAIISLTTSGLTVLPWDFDAAVAKPDIQSVVNSADGSPLVAPGGLISVLGNDLSQVTAANNQIPVPTILGDVCLTVNDVLAPLFLVSPGKVNAQLPFEVGGSANMILRTPGGTSNVFQFPVLESAPAIFRTGTAGPNTGLPTIVRAKNNELVTPSNPIHGEDVIIIYLTGLGHTAPAVDTGAAAPSDPLALVLTKPSITLGGEPLSIQYAGLVPGQVGVYQINAFVPFWVKTGMEVPLELSAGTQKVSLNVRVVQ